MAEVVTLPKLGFDMTEGTFVNWVKKAGDSVKGGDVIAEIESDKATIEVESTASGTLLKTLVQPGQMVQVGAPIAEISAEGGEVANVDKAGPAKAETKEPKESKEAPKEAPKEAQSAKAPAQATPNGSNKDNAPAPTGVSQGEEFPGGAKASPIARRIAEEKGIDLRQIQGTGPNGRMTQVDVENFKAPAAPVS